MGEECKAATHAESSHRSLGLVGFGLAGEKIQGCPGLGKDIVVIHRFQSTNGRIEIVVGANRPVIDIRGNRGEAGVSKTLGESSEVFVNPKRFDVNHHAWMGAGALRASVITP